EPASASEQVDRYFEGALYTLKSLFADERRRILNLLLRKSLRRSEEQYAEIYENHEGILQILASSGVESPRILKLTGEFVINGRLQRELRREALDHSAIRSLVERAGSAGLELDRAG